MCDSSWYVIYVAICAYKAKALKEKEKKGLFVGLGK